MAKQFLDLLGLQHFLDKLKSDRPIIELTSEEYEALEQSGEIDPKAFYFITDSDVPGRNPDTAMSSTSTNTVQNKVIKAYVDNHITPGVVPDTEMSSSSTNAVQNKVIKSYVDTQITNMRPDTAMSSSSSKAVQNRVIKDYIDDHLAALSPDTSMSSTSTKAVQNNVIKAYVDNQISNLRTELIALINTISPGISVSDTAPSDTSKVWIDTGGN